MNGRRISERCGSMDKHYGNSFEPIGGYAGYVGSPGLIDDPDDVFGGGKRKGSECAASYCISFEGFKHSNAAAQSEFIIPFYACCLFKIE
ncbi:UNVERIFIED_CONTAM: hypothetical protein Scaly_2267000 [Sesamum calycinum]|uniref:Uncharacterized protein n=1 Tax=Sesamum calycinum TaxID=2727403 RepID=A0AAW2MC79_9LAMI